MSEFLRVNIRQFEGEDDFSQYVVNGEIDIERLTNDFSSQQQDNEIPEDEPETPTEPEMTEPETPSEPEDEPETPEGTEPETPQEPQKNTPDQAFAQMRRQVEQYEPIAKWVQDLAVQQGFSDPQELINAFQQRQLEKEAEQAGVPVDVYQRLHQLETENKQKTEQMQAAQFNAEVDQVKAKYNLNDDQLTAVFQFMGQRGYDAGSIPFEDAYVLANRETLVQQAEDRGRQSYLEEKRKKQVAATPPAGTGAADGNKDTGLDYSSEGILNTFAKMGIPID